MSKYEKLTYYLASIDTEQVTLTFAEIEDIIGFSLPHSAYAYPAWWSNQASSGHSQTLSWQSIGWRTGEVNLSLKKVTFFRVRLSVVRETSSANSQRGVASPPHSNGLTIAEAKAGLSAHFGVPIESVEITIKG